MDILHSNRRNSARGSRADDDDDEDDEPVIPSKNKFGIKHISAMPTLDISHIERQKKMSVLHKESLINMNEQKMQMTTERHHENLLEEVKAHKIKPAGLLAVHIKSATFHNLDPTSDYEREDLSVYIRILSSRQLKTTCCYDGVYTPVELVFDDIRHIVLMPTDDRHDADNILRLEIAVFDPERPRQHRILATKEIHQYDIIKNHYVVERYEFVRIQTLIAEVDVEMCFSYGAFGYGCANQFENRRADVEDVLSHSMFMRVDAPAKRRDTGRKEVMTCTHVGHPSFIPFTKKVDIGSVVHEFGDEISLHDWQLADEPALLVSRIRRHMNIMMQELKEHGSRRERLRFLRRLVLADMPSVNDSHKEVVDVPKTFRLSHRHAPSQGGGNVFEALEEEQIDPNLINADLLGTQAEVLGLAPGINTRRMRRGEAEEDEEDEDEAAGFFSGLMRGFRRRMSVRNPAEVEPLPPEEDYPATRLTIVEENESLPTIPMGPLQAPSDTGAAPPLFSFIPNFIRRMSGFPDTPAPPTAPSTETIHSCSSTAGPSPSAESTISPPGSVARMRRVSVVGRQGSVTPGRRGSVTPGRRGSLVAPGGRRASLGGSRRGSLLVDDGQRRGSIIENLMTKLATLGQDQEPVEVPRVMLQPPTPEPSSESESDDGP